MFKKQLKLQKIICFAVLISCALAFIFSLGFMTDMYKVLYPAYDPDLAGPGYIGKFAGSKLFYEFQSSNNIIVAIALILIVTSLVLFINGCHSRRLYLKSNMIVSIAIASINFVGSLIAIIIISNCRNRFLTEVDFEAMAKLVESNPSRYTYGDSTLWFDLASAAFIIVILVALFLVVNLILKINLMKKENELLKNANWEV